MTEGGGRPAPAAELKLHSFRQDFEDHKDMVGKEEKAQKESVNEWDIEKEGLPKAEMKK